MTESSESVKIYVADLADYNAGSLHGFWCDLEGKDLDDVQTEIREFLKARTKATGELHEEYAIHDHENTPDYGEHGLEDYVSLQEVIDDCDDAGAVTAYAESVVGSGYPFTAEQFQDAYCGHWDSEQEYAEDWIDSTGMLANVPEEITWYFDFEKYADNMFNNSHVSVDAGLGKGVYVFFI